MWPIPGPCPQPEREALLQRCDAANMAIYRSPVVTEDKAIPIQLARQLGLHQLDGNWLADEDGISPIAVAAPTGDRTAFIPYTNRPIKWHTDGYYHPEIAPDPGHGAALRAPGAPGRRHGADEP